MIACRIDGVEGRAPGSGGDVIRDARGLLGTDAGSALVELRGAIGGVRLVSAGARVGRLRRKCLQAAVLAVCGGVQRERLRQRLLRECGNHDPAGTCGMGREARNLLATQRALAQEGVHVDIVSARCHE